MRNFKQSLLAGAAALLICTAALPAQADPMQATVAVVNIQGIMRDSSAAKSVREQLEQKQKAYQAEISKKEEALQKEDQELAKQRGVLAKEAFEEKVKAFRAKATDTQREVATKKAMLDNALERSLADIQKATTDIIAELAKEKNFNLAIPTSQLLYADSGMDISAEVLKRLNEKLPSVSVKFEAPAKK